MFAKLVLLVIETLFHIFQVRYSEGYCSTYHTINHRGIMWHFLCGFKRPKIVSKLSEAQFLNSFLKRWFYLSYHQVWRTVSWFQTDIRFSSARSQEAMKRQPAYLVAHGREQHVQTRILIKCTFCISLFPSSSVSKVYMLLHERSRIHLCHWVRF